MASQLEEHHEPPTYVPVVVRTLGIGVSPVAGDQKSVSGAWRVTTTAVPTLTVSVPPSRRCCTASPCHQTCATPPKFLTNPESRGYTTESTAMPMNSME